MFYVPPCLSIRPTALSHPHERKDYPQVLPPRATRAERPGVPGHQRGYEGQGAYELKDGKMVLTKIEIVKEQPAPSAEDLLDLAQVLSSMLCT